MSKVICDICGTVYSDTADSCPICGYSRNFSVEESAGDFPEGTEADAARGKGGRFSAANVKKNKEIFDYDAVNQEFEDEEETDDEPASYADEEDYDPEPRSNTFLVVILVIVITLLLLGTGFLLVRYYLPNVGSGETVPTTVDTTPVETVSEETTEPTIPCESLALTSGGTVELKKEGRYHLLHVVVTPEDTTDNLVFVSANEAVATVTEDGRITAVGEGETVIYITCGSQQIKCTVVVSYEEETQPPTEEETMPLMEGDEEADTQEETEAVPEATLADVVLKLKQTEFTLEVGYSHTIPLDCDLNYEDIEWSVEEDYIAKVENGTVTALRAGVTDVVAKYGDQVVECRVRCKVG